METKCGPNLPHYMVRFQFNILFLYVKYTSLIEKS